MIFLTGHHGAGKTTCAETLRPLGFLPIDLGPLIRDLHRGSGSALSLAEWCSKGEVREGPDFTNRILAEEVERIWKFACNERRRHGVVLVGHRSWRGIEYFMRRCDAGNRGSHGIVIYIDASFENLRRNRNKRENSALTAAQFAELIAREQAAGIGQIRRNAHHFLHNDSDEESLKMHFLALVRKVGYSAYLQDALSQ